MLPSSRSLWLILLLGLLTVVHGIDAQAQRSNQSRESLEGVELERKHGTTVPGDIVLRNEAGEKVRLGRFFDGERPVILNLVYHSCPMLCGLMLDGFTNSLQSLGWTPGDEFQVLTVSFNHREGPDLARAKKEEYVGRLDREGAADGWHFLTGSETAIERLTQSVGFQFRWIEEKNEYAHPTAQVFLSGDGTVTRYIHGIEVPGDDVRKALVEASNGEVGTAIDQAVMYCFQFDPDENTYTADAFNIMKIGSVFTVLLLGGILFVFWRREHRALQKHERWEDQAPVASS